MLGFKGGNAAGQLQCGIFRFIHGQVYGFSVAGLLLDPNSEAQSAKRSSTLDKRHYPIGYGSLPGSQPRLSASR